MMQTHMDYIRTLVDSGGPKPDQYDDLNQWFQLIGEKSRTKAITQDQLTEMWSAFGDAFSTNTMQGFVVNKPHGYAGDFEIIDKIYTKWLSPTKHLENWDRFFHWQKASIAVRNRKAYFKSLLSEVDNSEVENPLILNVGSGPCRDIFEYQEEEPSTKIKFECIDMDSRAIEYSKTILSGENVEHFCLNAFKFRPNKEYDLVWSAGLFDYLDDKQFVFLLRSLLDSVATGGELVVGNFSEKNPSRDYMEFGGWFLHHRTEEKLTQLAQKADGDNYVITIDREPSGVNLFLRITKP
ncbi:class I SAM-dependent methyltransferase [Enterovibrio calviensis]|uniref:class I SAM-dependent methyltransferase n=1 Tax=Enterovibrio calviensis TaxID=91359 RepID=UPI000A9451DD|nr:class I SAM-dependent methyltransferase [Enterovibrio calviensis]